MFSGIGGFEYGINKCFELQFQNRVLSNEPNGMQPAGFNTARESQSFTCIGFSEIDKYAISIYQKHFPGHKNYGDARDIIPEQLPDFDMLVGGFPCQSFSIAGKRQGFNDTRGTLFFEIARILQVKKPKWILLENVKGLLSHDNFRTITTIFGVLTELGYTISWEILNSKHFGVPQNRERIFIFGFREGCERKIFPIRQNEGLGKPTFVKKEKTVPCLESTMYKGVSSERFYGIREEPFIQNVPHGFNDGFQKQFPNLRAESSSEHNELLVKEDRIRRLTPVECERLQGFPDGWTEGISDTQRYKCLGNAVTTKVIEAIFRQL